MLLLARGKEYLHRIQCQATHMRSIREGDGKKSAHTWSKMKKKVVPGVCFSYDCGGTKN
jgi:hypothetical protein